MNIQTIVVNGDRLVSVAEGMQSYCLDFKTGEIIPMDECPADQIGEARPDLRNGKRYIRIPKLDEMHQQLLSRLSSSFPEDYEYDLESIPEEDQPDAIDLLEEIDSDIVWEEAVMRWIASLKPQCHICWNVEGICIDRSYDPVRGKWQDQ